MSRGRLHAVAWLAGLAVILTACGSAGELAGEVTPAPDAESQAEVGSQAEVESPAGTDEETDAFGEPELERPNLEEPRIEEPAEGRQESVALQLPGLPIGGFSEVVSESLQCAIINWSGPPDIVDGVSIRVTEVTFAPPGVFTLSDASCPGSRPPCLPDLWLSTEEPVCTVAVGWTGEVSADEGALFFSGGELRCQPDAREVCTGFHAEVEAREPKGIFLEPPPPGTTDTTGETAGNGGNGGASGGSAGNGGNGGGNGTTNQTGDTTDGDGTTNRTDDAGDGAAGAGDGADASSADEGSDEAPAEGDG